MKYNAPIGFTDPNDPYIDGNPGTGTEGSPVPASAIEHTQREIVNAIIAAGLVPDDGDLTQLHQAILALGPNTDDFIEESEVTAVAPAGAFGGALLHIQDQKPSGTDGGSSVSGNQTRDLNTVLTNEIAGASLFSNQIILPDGDYIGMATAPAYDSDEHKIFLRNVTDAADIVIGSSQYNSQPLLQTNSHLFGKFSVVGSKVFELQHYIKLATATYGLGFVYTAGSGKIEVYSDIKIWKVG